MIFLSFRIYYKLYYIKEKHSLIIQTTKCLTLQKCLDIFFQIPKEKHRYPIVSLKRGYTIISVQKRNRRLSFPQAPSIKINKNQFIKDGCIDMEHLLARFAVHFNDIYSNRDDAFVEKMGRKLFLLYLKPIINGVGNYYIEDQTRDETRTDVIIDYLGKQYIIELKIWRGNAYNERGEQQIAGYLDYFHAHTGYLLSFCFNKNKQPGVKTVQIDDKTIVECVV